MISRLIAWVLTTGFSNKRAEQVVPDPVIELLERLPVRH